MIEEPPLLAGEFSAATRLSAKALRIYAEQGLLVPANVDAVTGYRRYSRAQIPRARLISRLRALDLPLSRIAELADLPAEARQAELLAWLAAQEAELRRKRDLLTLLDETGTSAFGPVRLREVPAQKVLSAEARIYVDALDDFIAGAHSRIQAHLGVCDDAVRVYFHGLLTRDSDGPVEVGIAYQGTVEPAGICGCALSRRTPRLSSRSIPQMPPSPAFFGSTTHLNAGLTRTSI